MKKNHTLFIASIFILATSLLLFSCNADATAGLFRQISESKAPVGIIYKQIVGLDGTASPKKLFYLTDDGLYETDTTNTTKLVNNEEGEIIQAGYYDGTSDKIVFQRNDGTNHLYLYDMVTGTVESPAITTFSTYVSVKLLPNGQVLTGDSSADFSLYEYDDTAPLSPIVSTGSQTGYGLDAVLQLSGKEHSKLSATTPLLISLVNESGEYKHFYADGTSIVELDAATTKDERFVAMTTINSQLYVLTSEGDLYAADDPITSLSNTTAFTRMLETDEAYEKHAFMYATTDSTNTQLITKPDGINEPLLVISFPDNTVTSSGVSDTTVRDGYGEYLDAALIVGSYEKSPNILLVATLENGMFEINIQNNSSSTSEGYTL